MSVCLSLSFSSIKSNRCGDLNTCQHSKSLGNFYYRNEASLIRFFVSVKQDPYFIFYTNTNEKLHKTHFEKHSNSCESNKIRFLLLYLCEHFQSSIELKQVAKSALNKSICIFFWNVEKQLEDIINEMRGRGGGTRICAWTRYTVD